MKHFLPCWVAGLLVARLVAHAQGGVGIGTTTPDASAVLDLSASGKGLLVPRLDSAARVGIAAPATGLLVFQRGTNTPTRTRTGFYYYSGSSWLFLPDQARGGDNLGNGVATTALNLQGNALVGTGADLGTTVGVGVRADGGLNIGQNTQNVLLGYTSGRSTTGNNNAFVGYASGAASTSGSNNVFAGYYSGANNTSGSGNVFLGYESGLGNETGSGNIGLGFKVGLGAGLTNATAIGLYANVAQSNSLVLGGTGPYAVSVGIGTATPGVTLDVNGPTRTFAVTTPPTGAHNMLAVAYGTVGGSASNLSSSGNYTVARTPGATVGSYRLSFTAASGLSSTNLGTAAVTALLFGNAPGFVSYSTGTGYVDVFTYGTNSALTDRGFSFSVFLP